MEALKIIDNHRIIRETVGYDFISEIDLVDLPQVMKFLKVVYNYQRLQKINDL
jgi:hypothetical protein